MELDLTRLSRDYRIQPLSLREHLTYNEIYYLYIELNWCNKKINTFVGKNPNSSWAIKEAKRHGIEKTKEQQNAALEQYYLETIGVKNPALKPGAMDKMKQTMKEKYGVENIAHRADTIDKRKKTCLEKYGEDNPAKVQEFKDKAVQTSLEKFGVEHASQNKVIHQKQKDTMMKNYGVEYPYQSKEIMDRYRQTSLDKYGVDNIMKCDEGYERFRQSMLDYYGQENAMFVPEIMNKMWNTFIKRYGVNNPCFIPGVDEKKRKTCLEKYGVDNPSKLMEFQFKKYETMTKNNTWPAGESKPEKEIYELLCQKFTNVEKQYYTDKRYPFRCDFYVPELDLFIEYQGYQSHGFHPFNPDNEKDLEKVDNWWQKYFELVEKNNDPDNAYIAYINTWTIRDPLKRETAKRNKLNWIEFFTMKQFKDWYKSI